MGIDEILAVLREFKRDHGEQYGIIDIGIFGSFAHGEAREDSDVDIVFTTTTPNLFKTACMKEDLEELLKRSVDVVRLRDAMNPRMKDRIMREALYA
jgi:predicted nucleotidyltransferase